MTKMGIVIGILIVGFLLIINFNSDNLALAQDDSYTIEVDETSKTVHSGEDAIFIHYLKNNEQFIILEFIPSAGMERNSFEPEYIILNPGEDGIVIHTFNTTGLNSSFMNTFTISWLISWCGPFNLIKGPSNPSHGAVGRLQVIILENETINDTNENYDNDDSNLHYYPYAFLGITLLIAIIVSYYFFHRKKDSEFDDY